MRVLLLLLNCTFSLDKKVLRSLIDEILDEKQLEKRVDDLTQQLNETFSLADERFILNLEKSENDLFWQEKIEQRLAAMEQEIVSNKKLEDRLGNMEWEISALEANLMNIATNITSLTARLDSVANGTESDGDLVDSDVQRDLQSLQHYVDEIWPRMASELNKTSREVNMVKSSMAQLSERVNEENYEELIEELDEVTRYLQFLI